jgi:hypothetical protein
MTWSKSFTGTREQINEVLTAEGLPEQAQPASAAAEFIHGQLPDKGTFVVSAFGDRHRSDDGKSGSASIGVSFSSVAEEATTDNSTKAEESSAAGQETADAA